MKKRTRQKNLNERKFWSNIKKSQKYYQRDSGFPRGDK